MDRAAVRPSRSGRNRAVRPPRGRGLDPPRPRDRAFEDFAAAKARAAESGFFPEPLGVTADFRVETTHSEMESNNVIARIPGTEAPDETVIYTAHWDTSGSPRVWRATTSTTAPSTTPPAPWVCSPSPRRSWADGAPRRSVVFLAVTAEKQGRLGSRHYAENPLYSRADTVAALNMDGLNVWGPTSDVTVVGLRQSELDGMAADVAAGLGRTLNPDPEPEKGYD